MMTFVGSKQADRQLAMIDKINLRLAAWTDPSDPSPFLASATGKVTTSGRLGQADTAAVGQPRPYEDRAQGAVSLARRTMALTVSTRLTAQAVRTPQTPRCSPGRCLPDECDAAFPLHAATAGTLGGRLSSDPDGKATSPLQRNKKV